MLDMALKLKSHFWCKHEYFAIFYATLKCTSLGNIAKSVNQFYCMVLYHSQVRHHVINDDLYLHFVLQAPYTPEPFMKQVPHTLFEYNITTLDGGPRPYSGYENYLSTRFLKVKRSSLGRDKFLDISGYDCVMDNVFS